MAGLKYVECHRNWHMKQGPDYFASTVRQPENRLSINKSGFIYDTVPGLERVSANARTQSREYFVPPSAHIKHMGFFGGHQSIVAKLLGVPALPTPNSTQALFDSSRLASVH